MSKKSYVLITAARNEGSFIEQTIKSVISQSTLPTKWIIVSDGSTDDTDEIVSKYCEKHNFIELIRKKETGERDFCSKVHALNMGYARLKNINSAFIGNLDADVSLSQNYYEKVLEKFEKNSKLGIAGGIIEELINNKYINQNISFNSVAGAIQLFRRRCFEETGGYIPARLGGEDAIVEVMARMRGWVVQTFPEIKVRHHRIVGSGQGDILKARFRAGNMFYLLGYHPLFFIVRSIYRMIDRPFIIGSVLQISGYFLASIRREERVVSADFVKFLASEQIQRIKSLLNNLVTFKR